MNWYKQTLEIMNLNRHRHNVFVSYHHERDEYYRNSFEKLFSDYHNVIISKSVQIGDIPPNLKTETIRQRIRERYLRDSSVTVVLIGAETWRRKHVDWEIGASIRKTSYSERSGLLGIILPTYPRKKIREYDPFTIPPRLHYNVECGFAEIYDWTENPAEICEWIHKAFLRRKTIKPDNSYRPYVNNRSGIRWQP